MRAAVVIFPGSNRERDVCAALERATGHQPALVWHRDATLPETDLIILPGGLPTAIISVAGQWRRIRRSCARCATGPTKAPPFSASATASRS